MSSAIQAAKQAGYSDSEIAEFLAKDKGFDLQGARKAGYQDAEIVKRLSIKPESFLPSNVVKDPKTGGYAMPSLVADQGIGQTIMSGAGRTLDKWASGALQMLGIGDQKKLEAEQTFKDAAYKPLSNARPFAAGFGEGLPAAVATAPLVGPVSGLLGTGLAGLTATGTLLGAAPEMLKYGTTEERLTRGLWGGAAGALGALGGAAASKVFSPGVPLTSKPFPNQKPGAMDDAIAAAERVGYKLTAGDITGSEHLRGYENLLRQRPGIAGQMRALDSGNQRAINSFAAKAVNQNSDDLSESVLKSAYDTAKADYARIANAAAPDLQVPKFFDAIDRIDKTVKDLGKSAPPALKSLIDEALDLYSRGKIPGDAYATIRTEFGDRAAEAFKSNNSTLGKAYQSLQQVMDETAEASLPNDLKGQFKEVLRRYGDVKTLIKGQVVTAGNVSPARLGTALRTFNNSSYKTGTSKSELMDLARIGEAFKPYTNPHSGSAARDLPVTTEGLMSTLNNKIIGGAYMHPITQGYLTKARVPDEVRRAIALGGVPAGVAAGGPLEALVQQYFSGGQ